MTTLKTNFDGAIFEDLDAAGIGVVVRNSRGEIMGFLSDIIPMPSSIVVLESLATRRAVYLFKNWIFGVQFLKVIQKFPSQLSKIKLFIIHPVVI